MLSQSDFCADSHAFAAFTYAFTNNDLNSVVTPVYTWTRVIIVLNFEFSF